MAAVSGVYGRELAGVKISAGIPWTNSGLPAEKTDSENGGYLESIAKVSTQAQPVPDIKLSNRAILPWLSSDCDKQGWFVWAADKNGHRFYKEIYCGKEWCSRCGEDDSPAHKRKWSKWLPKLQQMESVGYFVFTIPESARGRYLSREALAALGRQVQELLKAAGFPRGLRRWHYFGDKSTKYHPHSNSLVDGEYISAEKLAGIKAAWALSLGVNRAVVHYHYLQKPGQIVHAVKYVARATFRDYRWNPELAVELRYFRNMVVWGGGVRGGGRWHGESAWSLADLRGKARAAVEGLDVKALESLGDKKCHICGEELAWHKPLPIGLLKMVDKTSLGAGYYQGVDVRAPPPLPEEIVTSLWQLEYLAGLKPVEREQFSGRLLAAHKRFALRKAARLEDLAALWQRWGN